MSVTLLRSGLWVVLSVLVLYVLHETYEESPLVEFFSPTIMQRALVLGGILLLAGLVMRLLEKGTKVVARNRCAVCRTPTAPGAIYCRAHLRRVLNYEDDRSHRTRIR